ncbi:YtxH domain-containing protein [Rathayibacter sp. YIM 133350]|uniref:YtxH domain-containing protein n=1 Tax=Rathayibacter sp. YIM 133350 TaxID=3131992 RepID=UPI00307E6068
MKGKLLFVVGLGTGYVLGTRAGRARYEQIRSGAEKVWNTPAVQKGVEQVKGFALARVGDVSETVLDGAKKLISSATKSQKSATSPVQSRAAGVAKDSSQAAAEAAAKVHAAAENAKASSSKDA